ncbi:hypothetical protein ES708_03717 [subsurface metagenome]
MGKLGDMVYEDLIARGKDVETARQWCRWVGRFVGICGEKDDYDRSDVIKFLAGLREMGFKQNSINTMVRPIRLLCRIQGWSGGFPRVGMVKVRESDIKRSVFSRDEVCEMIRCGKAVLDGRELAYLALSTIYALRREELTNLEVGDGTLKVDTVKGGVVTTHLIPDEIKPYLVGYERSGVRHMSYVFQRMMQKIGVVLNGDCYGWHSIRRALVTELVSEDAPLLNIVRFMRWSESRLISEFDMTF